MSENPAETYIPSQTVLLAGVTFSVLGTGLFMASTTGMDQMVKRAQMIQILSPQG